MADETIKIELDLDVSKLREALGRTEKGSGDAGKKAGSAFGSNFTGAINSFIGNLASDLVQKSIAGIKSEITNVIDAAKNLEVISTQFKTILGSTAAAQKQLAELQNFAATTPFQLPGLANSTRQLLSFGVAQDQIIPTLKQLGDIAAGVGAGIEDLTIPFGRLVSTQKLTLVELDKFADRGVNLYGKLAKQTGISLKDIRDEISKGKVPFEEFTKALGNLTNEGGTFFNAMQSQSKTLSGTLSTVEDNFFNLRGEIGKLFGPILIQQANDTIKQLQSATKFVQDNAVEIINSVADAAQGAISFIIAPVELLLNAGELVIAGINTAVAGFVAGLGVLGGELGSFLSNIPGMENSEFVKGLQTFKESSAETFEEVSANAKESLDGIFDFQISDAAASSVESFRETSLAAIEQAKMAKDEMVQVNNELNQSAAETRGNLQLGFAEFQIGLDETAETAKATGKKLAATMKNAIVNTTSQAIQRMTQSLIDGSNGFKGFGQFVLGVLGDMAIQMGQTLIFAGIGIESLKTLSGAAAIAAGAGLIALGTIIKSFAGGEGGLTGAGAGGGGGTVGGGPAESGLTEPEETAVEQQTAVTVNIQGDVLDSDETGMRVVDLINQSFDKQGVVIKRGAVA